MGASPLAEVLAAAGKKLEDALADSQVSPVSLASALDDTYGPQWREWEPTLLRSELHLPDDAAQSDKVFAVQVAVTNPDVFDCWTLFLPVTIAFNHRQVNFDWVDQPSYLECAWACVCLRKLQPTGSFGPEVHRFLVAICLEAGLAFFPWTGDEGIIPGEFAAKGVANVVELGQRVRDIWKKGELQDLRPSQINETDPLQEQLAKIVAAQEYIRAQHGTP